MTHPELFRRYPMPPALADVEGMLERKSEAGIGLTIVGSPVGFGTMMPVPGFDQFDQSRDDVNRLNDWLAELVDEYTPRLAAYLYTNPFGDEAMLADAAERIAQEQFVGFMINTSVGGAYLDSARADDFFAMAAEAAMPIFLHPPARPVGEGSFSDWRLVEQVGRFLDVTAALAAMVFAGRLEQYPDLQLIAATAGGAIALLADRLDAAYRPRHYGAASGGAAEPGPPRIGRFDNRISELPSEYLRRVYVDTANWNVQNQVANLELMGAGRILFGTDSPPLATPLDDAVAFVRALPISEEEREAILHGNAERLFRLPVRH